MATKKPTQFDTLLRIRRRQEDFHAAALAKAQRDVQQAEALRNAILRQQRLMFTKAGERTSALFDPREIRAYYQYERHLQYVADNQDVKILELKKVAEDRRLELEDAMKRRRIIEKLIERKVRAYQQEIRNEEQHQADEISSNYASLVGQERLHRGGGPAISTVLAESPEIAMEI